MYKEITIDGPKPLNPTDLMQRQDLVQIIEQHALGGAAAGLGIAWLPGAGSAISTAAAVTALWSMYFRINKCIGLRTSKVMLRTIASAMMSNIAQAAIYVVAGTAVASLLSLTGIGNVASSLIMASVDYAVIYVGGVMYLKLLTGLMRAGCDPDEMQPEEVKDRVRQILAKEDINAMIRQRSSEYKRGRKNGSITGHETYTAVEM